MMALPVKISTFLLTAGLVLAPSAARADLLADPNNYIASQPTAVQITGDIAITTNTTGIFVLQNQYGSNNNWQVIGPSSTNYYSTGRFVFYYIGAAYPNDGSNTGTFMVQKNNVSTKYYVITVKPLVIKAADPNTKQISLYYSEGTTSLLSF